MPDGTHTPSTDGQESTQRIDVLDRGGLVRTLGGGLTSRAAATAEELLGEAHGLALGDPGAPLPWRDAAAREGQARRIAADRALSRDERRGLIEHLAATPVLEAEEASTVVHLIGPPDWALVERLGDDGWDDDGAPSRLLTVATVRTEDGAVIGCSGARFSSAHEREAAVRSVASDGRLTSAERRGIAARVARTPVRVGA